MKRMKQLARRMLRCRAPRRKGKSGSSMALAMIITSALVIWAMALAPLMATTGTNALKVQTGYTDYLGSRSAIEFAKSELEYIVQTETPYTFAVIRDVDVSGNEVYSAVRKRQSNMQPNSAYSDYVQPDPLASNDDTKDTPKSGANGDKVAAICAVTEPAMNSNQYEILITSFNKGAKGITYKATFTMKGSLMINPESYKQKQALPLSDFVLVDGILGGKTDASGNWVANQIWESTITMSSAENLRFRENLLPWNISPAAGYADSGEYPAVFKTTVHAALDDESHDIGDEIVEPPYTNEIWSKPKVSTNETNGAIKMSSDGRTILMYRGSSFEDVTDLCSIYYNGSSSYPTTAGIYRVSVDFFGTGEYTAGAANVLPGYGLELGTINVKYSGSKFSAPTNCKIEEVTYTAKSTAQNGDEIAASATVKLQATAPDGVTVMYGYSTSDNKTSVTWGTSDIITIDPTKTHYFFCYIAAGTDERDLFYNASDVVYAGMVYPYTAAALSDNSRYIMMGAGNLAACVNNGALCAAEVDSTMRAGTLGAGVLYGTPNDSLIWHADQNYANRWYFSNSGTYLNISKDSANISSSSSRIYADGNSDNTYSVYQKFTEWVIFSYNRYLNIGASCSVSENSSPVYFVKIPDATPSLNDISTASFADTYSITPNDNIVQTIKNNYSNVATVYANGSTVSSTLKTGSYLLTGTLTDGTLVYLGTADVSKLDLFGELSVDVAVNEKDDQSVTITGGNWHDNGGARYFGYTKKAESRYESDAPTRWFSTTEDSFTFRLPYGKYTFHVEESGNGGYNSTEKVSDTVTLAAGTINITPEMMSSVTYTYDPDTNEITWYGSLPEGVTPSKIKKIVYGKTYSGLWTGWETVWHWTDSPLSGFNLLGVVIEGNTYQNEDNYGSFSNGYINKTDSRYQSVVLLPESLGTSHVAGHQSSMISGSSLYFMGGGDGGTGNSINTFGNDIYLKTDLLVLNSSITGTVTTDAGFVYVEPYSTNEGDPGDTLLFAVHDLKNSAGDVVFLADHFYKIPKDTCIYTITPSAAADLVFGAIDYDDVDPDEMKDVKFAFRYGYYPKLNLDIAYADSDQLAHIISSETIDWTNKGILSGNSSSTNAQYAVCTFVNSIDGAVDYTANRVLLAAKDAYLTVPSNVEFTTRYLSLDTATLQQGASGVKFVIKNLGQDPNFIQWISDILRLTNYSSKSLQVDYERQTLISLASGSQTPIKSQICRYLDGQNLFDSSVESQDLMAVYTTQEIENLFEGGLLSWVSSTVKTVDRYITLTCKDGSGDIDVSALLGLELDIYANYIYVDPSVAKIKMTSYGGADVVVSSQENGYTSEEYLGLFKGHSADAYSGTLMYFAADVYLFLDSGSGKLIPKGFYYVPASDPDGISLTELAENPMNYTVSEEELARYSIYINKETGKLSDAYVDTGLEDSSASALGGFSGGKVE